MEYLLLIIVGFVFGNIYATRKFLKQLKDTAEKLGIDVETEINKLCKEKETPKVRRLIVERHGSMLYLYDKESDDFVCQGKNIDELAELSKKYKNIIGAVVLHDDKVFMFMNGLSKEFTG
jgi:hypothetical protein